MGWGSRFGMPMQAVGCSSRLLSQCQAKTDGPTSNAHSENMRNSRHTMKYDPDLETWSRNTIMAIELLTNAFLCHPQALHRVSRARNSKHKVPQALNFPDQRLMHGRKQVHCLQTQETGAFWIVALGSAFSVTGRTGGIGSVHVPLV